MSLSPSMRVRTCKDNSLALASSLSAKFRIMAGIDGLPILIKASTADKNNKRDALVALLRQESAGTNALFRLFHFVRAWRISCSNEFPLTGWLKKYERGVQHNEVRRFISRMVAPHR